MAYENVQMKYRNFTGADGYFYTFDSGQDNLVVKTDDGTVAFTYPLDTTISNDIVSLEFDGYNFWTLENPASNVIIRRWQIQNYVCVLQETFDDLTGGGDWSFDSEALAIEHYYLEFTAPEAAGPTNNVISVGDTNGFLTDISDKVEAGMSVRLGPNSSGETEDFGVVSAAVGSITLNGALTKSYASSDPVYIYTKIWLFNSGTNDGDTTAALLSYDPYGNVQPDQQTDMEISAEYDGVTACTFSYIADGLVDVSGSPIYPYALAYVKSSNLLFKDVENPSGDPDYLTNYGSMAMDNIEDDDITIIPVYDMFIQNKNVYRLQRKATYYGTTYTFSDSAYSYQLATLEPFVHSIALQASPAVLPADGVSSSTITAVVKSQFLNAISGRRVDFTEDGDGGLSSSWDTTDSDGVATTSYTAGSAAQEVKITATAKQS